MFLLHVSVWVLLGPSVCTFNCLQGSPCGRLIFTFHVCVCERVFVCVCQCQEPCPQRGPVITPQTPWSSAEDCREPFVASEARPSGATTIASSSEQYPDVVGIESDSSYGCRAVAPPMCGPLHLAFYICLSAKEMIWQLHCSL